MTSVRRTAVHASSSFAKHVGALATAIAVICIAGVCPLPCGGQTWNTNGSSIYYNAGSVGVGTMSPMFKLHTVGMVASDQGSNIYTVLGQDPGSYASTNITGSGIWYDSTINALRIAALTGGVAWRNIVLNGNGGGNVGIGTTNPLNLVQVRAGVNYNLGIRYDGATNSIGIGAYNDAGTTPTPLAFNASSFAFVNGNVGIGTTNPTSKLSVNGTIQAKEVVVNTGWSDYVFQPAYRLKPLSEVAAYIQQNHHLPDIPSEAEVREKGISLGEMQSKLLAKIEEITLHLIQSEDRNRDLEARIARIEGRAASLQPNPAPTAASPRQP